jgi:SAM-dependent methyltransferase
VTATLPPLAVIWHDAECGSYTADLPLWRELAAQEPGPILDVGAGTGRVALDLAARGHDVTALDADPVLLGALAERATVPVTTVVGDALAFDLSPRRFGLILVPMQTIQLLPDRSAFLAAARRHLAPGGLLAAALAEALEGFDPGTGLLPAPDLAEHAGWRFASQPVAVRELADRSRIERIRTSLAPDGTRTAEGDAVDLAHVAPETLHEEGRAAGLTAEAGRRIPATEDHVGSEVVLLRG